MPGLESVPPWVALYVKSRHEKHVVVHLGGKGVESFLPTYVKRYGNSKRAELPLFPGYVFCRLPPSSQLPVLMTPGVFYIVSKAGIPTTISDAEIDAVKSMLKPGFVLKPWSYGCPGQEIRVNSGPLRGLRGVLSEASNDKWLVVSVDLLRRSVAVKLHRDFLCSADISYGPA